MQTWGRGRGVGGSRHGAATLATTATVGSVKRREWWRPHPSQAPGTPTCEETLPGPAKPGLSPQNPVRQRTGMGPQGRHGASAALQRGPRRSEAPGTLCSAVTSRRILRGLPGGDTCGGRQPATQSPCRAPGETWLGPRQTSLLPPRGRGQTPPRAALPGCGRCAPHTEPRERVRVWGSGDACGAGRGAGEAGAGPGTPGPRPRARV